MRRLLCRFLGLHHYVFTEHNPTGYCKHCGARATKTISAEDWEEIRHKIELLIARANK